MSSQLDPPASNQPPPPQLTENYLRAASSLIGDEILSKDGETCGKIRDFLFDDSEWTIRYVVGDTGGFLSRHEVLLSPFVFDKPEFGTWNETIATALSKEWIEASPPLDSDAPVSERYELELARHYSYVPYWTGSALGGMGPYPVTADLAAGSPAVGTGTVPSNTASDSSRLATDEKIEVERHESEMASIRDSHLRSCATVTGYAVESHGEEIGEIDDFIVETLPWRIRYLVVNTGGWLSGRKILISPEWAGRISWQESKVFVPGFARAKVENAPSFEPGIAINRSYEGTLYDYYGRPHYW